MRRTWEVNALQYENGEYMYDDYGELVINSERLDEALLSIRPQLQEFGGVIAVVPKRVRVRPKPNEQFETRGWIFRYDSGAPAADAPAVVHEAAQDASERSGGSAESPAEPEPDREAEPEPQAA